MGKTPGGEYLQYTLALKTILSCVLDGTGRVGWDGGGVCGDMDVAGDWVRTEKQPRWT